MLSLEDVRNVSFRKARFGGYKPEDVDTFIDDLQVSYEKLLRERSDMMSKIEKMRSFIEKCQSSEGAIKDVILNAQHVAKKSLADAEEETQNMIDEATKSSQKMIADAKKEVAAQNEIASRIRAESTKLKEKLAEIYDAHMKIINDIPEFVEEHIENNNGDDGLMIDEKPKLTPEEKVNRIISSATTVDIFSEQYSDNEFAKNVTDSASDKFKNLEFGDNYNYN